jgi:WD40 repeat protein
VKWSGIDDRDGLTNPNPTWAPTMRHLLPVVLALLGGPSFTLASEFRRFDAHGDPLPAGALTRLGSMRFAQPSPQFMTYSPDGKTLITVGRNRTYRVWDAHNGRLLKQYPLDGEARLGQPSPDGRLLALATSHEILIVDVATGKTRATWDSGAIALAFLPETQRLVTLYTSGSWDHWSADKG